MSSLGEVHSSWYPFQKREEARKSYTWCNHLRIVREEEVESEPWHTHGLDTPLLLWKLVLKQWNKKIKWVWKSVYLLLKLMGYSSDDPMYRTANHRGHNDILHLHISYWPIKNITDLISPLVMEFSQAKGESRCKLLFCFLLSALVQHLPSPRPLG